MSSYFQVDRGLFTSSVWLTGTPEERVLWLWLLGNRDDAGVVPFRELAIADGAKLPRAVVDAALAKFASPDPDSRTADNEGRRIGRTLDGFFRILNHERYYSKDYSTPRWRRWKDRQHANALANAQTPLATKDKDKDNGTDTPPTPLGGEGTTDHRRDRKTSRRRGQLHPDAQAVADRFVAAFNGTFGRRVSALPPLVDDVSARLTAGYQPDQLVAVAILTDAQGLRDDLRRDLQPRWLLRVGAHPRATRDGGTAGGKDWIGAALDRASGTRLWPRHVEVARDVGVLDELHRLGCRISEDS